ncbi:hypothetical protein FQR65_LT04440 [Abscondita terminalis]|nr:hypothetical protein FQR65_LT04440 [Abscondita terminalis]
MDELAKFRCVVDCNLYPNDCISDKLFREMADRMAEDGYLEAGYEYLVIDDCWLEMERNAEGKLQPDRSRFPYGMKNLSDYVHSKGLKFGMYEDIGTYTCAGYPGIKGYLEIDANTFAEWDVDYIKIDGCYAKVDEYKQGYTDFGRFLNKTGRPIVYSCSWPAYLEPENIHPDYAYLAKICNLWRNWDDIQDSYASMTSIANWFAKNQQRFITHAGPGNWNDPDMLLIGNYGLSIDQGKSQMALWAIMAAPLLMSVDFRTIDKASRDILLNRDVIAVNQDYLGIQGEWLEARSNIDIWIRKISPVVYGKYSYAIAFQSRRDDGYPLALQLTLSELGLDNSLGYSVTDLFEPTNFNHLFVNVNEKIVVRVKPSESIFALDNGLALTPPMGWMSWQRFRCLTDCELYPDDCISDKLFRKMADLMVSEGYLEAGYEYLIIDDCWLEKERDENGRLQPDRERFPYGMKNLSDYVHGKGLKFGMYEDYGRLTCAGYPGILGHLKVDADTFAEWGVDYIKIDGCYAKINDYEQGYTEFGQYLNKTNRPMVYSCSWPAYLESNKIHANYSYLAQICNLWRNWGDIQDSYSSMTSIIDWFAQNQKRLIPFAGPGHWNDPDMLLIGNYGLSIEQSRSQMALWAILTAPLLMSLDFRTIGHQEKQILLNKEIIAINQDPLGIQGYLVKKKNNIEMWARPITPIKNGSYSFAVAFCSRRTDGHPYAINVTLREINLVHEQGYNVRNIYEFRDDVIHVDEAFIVRVKPSGVVLLKLTPL